CGICALGVQDSVFADNLITRAAYSGIRLDSTDAAGPADRNTVANNTVSYARGCLNFRDGNDNAAFNNVLYPDSSWNAETRPASTAVAAAAAASGTGAGTTARVSWTTSEPADAQVEYGTSAAYGSSSTLDPALALSHAVGLAGLAPGTTYHYRVRSRDAAGNLAVSGDFTFTTPIPDTTPPIISAVAAPASGVTALSAMVTWTTNEAADTQVEYGPTAAYGA